MNALEELLYRPDTYQKMKGSFLNPLSPSYVPYQKGMSITLCNTRQHAYELHNSLKRIYQTIYETLTKQKISGDNILTSTGKVPNRKTIMDMVIKDQPILVGAIHKYRDMKFDEFHLHLYVYGVHNYLQESDGKIRFEKLKHNLHRYLKSKKRRFDNPVDIREVGINSNTFNDDISPATVHEYLNMPKTNPEQKSWINYLAETQRNTEYKTPLYYLYQKI